MKTFSLAIFNIILPKCSLIHYFSSGLAVTELLISINSHWGEWKLEEYSGKESLYFCSAPMTFPYILYRYLLLAAAGSRMVGKIGLLCFLS